MFDVCRCRCLRDENFIRKKIENGQSDRLCGEPKLWGKLELLNLSGEKSLFYGGSSFFCLGKDLGTKPLNVIHLYIMSEYFEASLGSMTQSRMCT